MENKIEQLIKTSKKVILDCSLENGAIVAANSTKAYYPKEAKNYFYVWPRDASFTCLASDILGIKDTQERFFDWLMNRAEGWQETGLFYEKYYPNGLQALNKFQPDQTAAVLFAVWYHFKDKKKEGIKYKELVVHSANGICNAWKKDHFSLIANDLWEERLTFPDLKENFTYSLAACIRGLLSASQLFPDKKYIKIADEMKEVLLKNAEKKEYFFRSFGRVNDERIDSSMLGLIWPFEIIEIKHLLVKNTVKLIKEKLVKDFGVYRYEHDEYDGWMFQTLHRKKGAGFWPVLNFWMSIILTKMSEKEEAMKYYKKVIDLIDEYIPEQIFHNKIQKSISPLCWSHAMFIIASKELGFL
jgi:GH15 family glucan-1,4-alpha-glucosidase